MEVILTGRAAGVDHADASHVTVGDLVTNQINRVFRSQIGIDFGVGFAEFDGVETTVTFGLFLLDDVCTDGGGEVVGLPGQIGSGMIDSPCPRV